MAATTREDRALMRVRGAGSRKVPTVDFGFNFAFGNKQQRQQVPTPARSLRSNTKTPQSRRSTSRQPSKTPARRSRELSSAPSIRQISAQPSVAEDTQGARELAPTAEGLRLAKRRRITPDFVIPNTSISVEKARPVPSTRASRRRTASQIFTIAEDADETTANDATEEQRQTSPLFVPEEDRQKENETPNDTRSKSAALGLDLQTTKSGRILLDPSTFPNGDDEEDEAELETWVEETLPSVLESSSLETTGASSTTGRRKPRKRKTLTLDRRRRRSSTLAQSEGASKESTANVVSSRIPSEETVSSKLPMASRISKYSKLAKKRTQQQTLAREREDTPKDAEDDDDSYVEDSEPEPETPAVNKKTNKVPRKRRSRSQSAEASEGKKGRDTFPILTHRLAEISTLPTIHEDEREGTPFGDALTQSLTERTQPNVVDVLAQICRETISNMIERIADTTKRSEKATAKNKQTALEAFGKDLDDELFAMSEAVEHRIALEARVRKGKREKASLQSEYLELRKEREQIALRCDAVRREHWECEEDTRQKWTLSEAARRAEQEMERNAADEDEGMEFLLRSVAQSVSSASIDCGILDKIKYFNAQLENMALLLEGRDV